MKSTSVNSRAEEWFDELFCDAFGPDKATDDDIQNILLVCDEKLNSYYKKID